MITSISISLITDLSLVSYNLTEYLYFYKMKTFKISCRKVKICISPRGGNFQFSARGETYVYLKKISPRGEFHLACVYHACGLACSGLRFSGFRGFVSISVLLGFRFMQVSLGFWPSCCALGVGALDRGCVWLWGVAAFWPFPDWGGCGLCPQSRARSACASPSEVYVTGKLQWHFTCGFNFRHSLWHDCHLWPLLQSWRGY